MYSVGWLIVEREISRSRLLQVFEVPAGKRTNGFRTPPISDGPQSIGLSTRLKTRSDLSAADAAGFVRLSQGRGTEPGHGQCQAISGPSGRGRQEGEQRLSG